MQYFEWQQELTSRAATESQTERGDNPLKFSQTECQVLVIGGGGAGAIAAIAAAEEGARVTLVNQGPVARTGLTVMAGGGIEWSFGRKRGQSI